MQYIVKSKIGFGGNLGWSTCPAEQSKSWNCSNVCQEMQFSSQFGHFLEITLDRVLEQAMLLDESSIKLFGSSLHLCLKSLSSITSSWFGASTSDQFWIPSLVWCRACQPNLIHNTTLSFTLSLSLHPDMTNFKFCPSFGAGLPSRLPTKPDSRQFMIICILACICVCVCVCICISSGSWPHTSDQFQILFLVWCRPAFWTANQTWFTILRLWVPPLSEPLCVFWPKPFNIPSPTSNNFWHPSSGSKPRRANSLLWAENPCEY